MSSPTTAESTVETHLAISRLQDRSRFKSCELKHREQAFSLLLAFRRLSASCDRIKELTEDLATQVEILSRHDAGFFETISGEKPSAPPQSEDSNTACASENINPISALLTVLSFVVDGHISAIDTFANNSSIFRVYVEDVYLRALESSNRAVVKLRLKDDCPTQDSSLCTALDLRHHLIAASLPKVLKKSVFDYVSQYTDPHDPLMQDLAPDDNFEHFLSQVFINSKKASQASSSSSSSSSSGFVEHQNEAQAFAFLEKQDKDEKDHATALMSKSLIYRDLVLSSPDSSSQHTMNQQHHAIFSKWCCPSLTPLDFPGIIDPFDFSPQSEDDDNVDDAAPLLSQMTISPE